jgi:hypothetical protein
MPHLRLRFFVCLILGCQSFLVAQQRQPDPAAAEARKVIQDGNTAWGKARVAHDRATFEKMLSPDFFVQLPEKKVSRQEFIELISTPLPTAKMTRFDPVVLTVERDGDAWEALILERLESERSTPDGKKQKVFGLFITKDKWQKSGEKWQILSSTVAGNEFWTDNPPPLSLWSHPGS